MLCATRPGFWLPGVTSSTQHRRVPSPTPAPHAGATTVGKPAVNNSYPTRQQHSSSLGRMKTVINSSPRWRADSYSLCSRLCAHQQHRSGKATLFPQPSHSLLRGGCPCSPCKQGNQAGGLCSHRTLCVTPACPNPPKPPSDQAGLLSKRQHPPGRLLPTSQPG